MRLWHILQSRLRSIVFRDRRESDLSEELQLHLERETERLQASGMSRDQARLQALRLFGGVEQIKEASRDARGTAGWDALVRDARHGLRRLVRDWRFTTAAVLILGLAIGANTAIFSVVNAVLFREEALADPDRLVNIYQNDRAGRPLIVTSVLHLHGDRGVHRHLCGDDGRQHAEPRPLSLRRRRPRCGRRVRDGDVSRHPGTPAVARPLVRRDRRNGPGLRSSPFSDIRRGPDDSVRTHPSSDASSGSKAVR